MATNSRSECATLGDSIFFDTTTSCDLSTDQRIGLFGGITGFVVVMVFVRAFTFCVLSVRSSGVLHRQMVQSVLRAPVHFFDTNSVGEPTVPGTHSTLAGSMSQTYMPGTHSTLAGSMNQPSLALTVH